MRNKGRETGRESNECRAEERERDRDLEREQRVDLFVTVLALGRCSAPPVLDCSRSVSAVLRLSPETLDRARSA